VHDSSIWFLKILALAKMDLFVEEVVSFTLGGSFSLFYFSLLYFSLVSFSLVSFSLYSFFAYLSTKLVLLSTSGEWTDSAERRTVFES